ncbi:hypothetical protein C0J52_24071 [Blattella germanica]|nr:hypothetical protein C0J52_24071 [Blattella germanica]
MNGIPNLSWSRRVLPIFRAILFQGETSGARYLTNLYHSRYNDEQQKQILEILNDCDAEKLSRFDISKHRINNLQQFRHKHGPFCTLEEVLEVNGLGVKVLEKLCDSILKYSTSPNKEVENNESELINKVKSLSVNSRSQIMTPIINPDQRTMLKTAVGIHVGVSAVTWAHMDRSGELLDWNIYDLEFTSKRLHVTSLFEIARCVCDAIPKGDVYVLEDKTTSIMSTQQQASAISINLQNTQLTAMFVALLNGDLKSLENEPLQYDHRVFFLRSRLPARLFRTLIGTERVSAQTVVLELLSANEISTLDSNSVLNEHSPISVSDSLKEAYLNRNSMEKESLCWALLLIMTFMDLAVHENPFCSKNIRNGR